MKKKTIFFNYHYLSFLVKDLYGDNQNKNDKILKNTNESLITLRNAIDSKGTPEIEKLKKQSVLLKKSLNLINNKKNKGIKI